MTSYLAPASLAALLASATLLVASPAEDLGEESARGATVSAETQQMVAQKLSGDDIEDRITLSDDIVSTQNFGISPGRAALAAQMGVDAADHSLADLVDMSIGGMD